MIIAQLLLTVDFMSRKGIIHRDLKPENILLSSKNKKNLEIRIADFGFSLQTNLDDYEQYCDEGFVCGTGGYIPPEALQGRGFSLKADIFSVGSIMYSLLTLRNLFIGRDQNEILRANQQCDLEHVPKETRKCSIAAQDLLIKLLSINPESRPTAAEALEHPWFANEQGAVIGSLAVNAMFTMGRNNESSNNVSIGKAEKKLFSMCPALLEALSNSPVRQRRLDASLDSKFRQNNFDFCQQMGFL